MAGAARRGRRADTRFGEAMLPGDRPSVSVVTPSLNQGRFLSTQHGGLAAAVGMTAGENAAGDKLAQGRNSVFDALAIAGSFSRSRRTERTGQAKWQIVTQHHETRARKGICQRYQQRSLAIESGAMGENQSVAGWRRGPVQESAHRRVGRQAGK